MTRKARHRQASALLLLPLALLCLLSTLAAEVLQATLSTSSEDPSVAEVLNVENDRTREADAPTNSAAESSSLVHAQTRTTGADAVASAFMQKVKKPLTDKIVEMMVPYLKQTYTPKFVSHLTSSLSPALTFDLTEALRVSVVKEFTPKIKQTLTEDMVEFVTKSLTETLTHSLTHSLSHALTDSLTRGLSQILTESIVQTVIRGLSRKLQADMSFIHNNQNYYLYYRCFYLEQLCLSQKATAKANKTSPPPCAQKPDYCKRFGFKPCCS